MSYIALIIGFLWIISSIVKNVAVTYSVLTKLDEEKEDKKILKE